MAEERVLVEHIIEAHVTGPTLMLEVLMPSRVLLNYWTFDTEAEAYEFRKERAAEIMEITGADGRWVHVNKSGNELQ